MIYVLLVVTGMLASTIGSVVGLGGGIIVVPTLLFLADHTALLPREVTPQIAVGISMFVLIFTGLSSTTAYMKQKTVDYRTGLLFLLGSGPGGIAGAYLNKQLSVQQFSLYFGLFVIFVSLLLMVRDKIKPLPRRGGWAIERTMTTTKETVSYSYHPVIAIVIAFFVGMISSLFGIGGGALMVPALILLFAVPAYIAVATSMMMIFLSAIISSWTHVQLGHIDWLYALALAPGAWIGGQLGAWLNARMKNETVILCLRILLLVVGVRLILQSIG